MEKTTLKPANARRVDDTYKQAARAMRARDWQKAIDHWQALRKLQGNAVSAYDQAARALMHLDRTEEAETLLQQGRRRFPKNAAIAMRHAALAEHRKDWALAVTCWENFHGSFEGTAHSHLQYARALVQAGQTDDAESLLLKAEQQWPTDKLIAVQLAEIAVHRREWPVALQRWQSVRQRFDDTSAACLGESETLIALGRYDEAEQLLQQATNRYPDQPLLLMRYANVAMHREAWDTACIRWQAFRQRFGNKPEALELEAEALIQAEKLEQAESLLVMAVKRFPNRRPLAFKLAQLSSQRQDWAVAIQCWRRLRKRFKPTVECYKAESWACAQAGHWDDAESLLETAMKRWPRNKSLHLCRAEYAMSREDWTTAAARWVQMCRDFPDTPKAWLRGTRAYIQMAEFDLAENFIREAINHFPGHAELMTCLAEIDQARTENTSHEAWQAFYSDLMAGHLQMSGSYKMGRESGNELSLNTEKQADVDSMDAGLLKRLLRKISSSGTPA